jgi:hypothetical protein
VKTVSKVLGWVLATLFGLSLLTCTGQMWLMQVPILLAVGWCMFLLDVLPEVTFRWGAIAETVAVSAVLGVGTHLFLRRLWRQLRPEVADARPWLVRWSVSLVALIVLLFSATMATVGIGHHVGWLATSREPLVESSWRFNSYILERDYMSLCRQALSLSQSGVTDAQLVQALLRDPETRADAEQLYVLPWRGSEGEVGLLVFSRDPLTREHAGGVRCGGGLKESESIKAAELPRLLSESKVAADTAP